MPCFRPLTAWQLDGGEVVFTERGQIKRELQLSCGRCIGCRIMRGRSWAIRCVHESQMHPVSSFVTLTYERDPVSLHYPDFQKFMKRLRKWNGPTRFFAVGEYGDLSFRPHFHALLFGCSFDDGKLIGTSLKKSSKLSELWPHGFASFGEVTYQSAAYVARYAIKKVNGPAADDHYRRVDPATGESRSVVPEFGRMSLKPGIGEPWFRKYWGDVFHGRNGVVMNGKTVPAPRYYQTLLERTAPEVHDIKQFERYLVSQQFKDDCTPDRLAVREVVEQARTKFYKDSKL